MDKPYENLSDDHSYYAAAVVLIASALTGLFSCAVILAVLTQVAK